MCESFDSTRTVRLTIIENVGYSFCVGCRLPSPHRRLRRLLDEMPRTINPASERILADLRIDRAPADRASSAER